ncbi:hypothetical protein DF159_12080 [Burkholderia ubonensis]|nr:hypothetical protein DF154_14610 [Burkholderia ubonensis]RQP62923.1 hypothetical protein DF159_12080 [Burkholderia ubonensis]
MGQFYIDANMCQMFVIGQSICRVVLSNFGLSLHLAVTEIQVIFNQHVVRDRVYFEFLGKFVG